MKRHIAVVLIFVLALTACLCPMAAAAQVSLSTQNLSVDGEIINCEKYNIDGSNYFKLRDIAHVLNGTPEQFSVNWDAEAKVISIVTGEAYTSNGTELDLSGGDKSATATVSSQTIQVNGTAVADLSVYNIGGNNYFKLRELADVLDLYVDYDAETMTAIIETKEETVWLQTKETTTETVGEETASSQTVWTYDGNLNVLTESITAADGTSQSRSYIYGTSGNKYSGTLTKADGTTSPITYTYNEFGDLLSETEDGVTQTYTYDDYGSKLTSTIVSAESIDICTYAYDDNGSLAAETYASTSGTGYQNLYTYNEEGVLTAESKTNADGSSSKSIYAYDANGSLLTETCTLSSGIITMTTHVYDENGKVQTSTVASSDGSNASVAYTYDEAGNLSTMTTTGSDGSKVVVEYEWQEFTVPRA